MTSKMEPRMQAVLRVKTLEPTEVPNEFATSFAPTPKASINDTMKPAITKGRSSGENGSIVVCVIFTSYFYV